MKQSLNLLRQGFQSSSQTTPEFLQFYRTFKKELTKALTAIGCTKIEIGKGHFYCSGFFTSPSGQIYYISVPDVRSFREDNSTWGSMMYRTAQHYKDFSGGSNQWIQITDDMVSQMRIN